MSTQVDMFPWQEKIVARLAEILAEHPGASISVVRGKRNLVLTVVEPVPVPEEQAP